MLPSYAERRKPLFAGGKRGRREIREEINIDIVFQII